MVVHHIKFAGSHLYIWVERGTVRVKCLPQEHNAMFLARARTQTTRSGVKCSNHEATMPSTERKAMYLMHGPKECLQRRLYPHLPPGIIVKYYDLIIIYSVFICISIFHQKNVKHGMENARIMTLCLGERAGH